MMGSVSRSTLSSPARAFACAWLASLLALLPVLAEERPPEYFTRTWTTDDGLPHNSASLVLQDTTGFIWFGTVGGLARFDGHSFLEWRPPLEFRTGGFNIRSAAIDGPGRLIVLSTGRKVLTLEGTAWGVHPCSAALDHLQDSPTDVFVERSGIVWIATSQHRLLRWQPDGSSKLFGPLPAPNKPGNVLTLATEANGDTWVALDTSLLVYRNGELVPIADKPSEPVRVFSGLNGSVWAASGRRLYRLEQGRLQLESEDSAGSGALDNVRFLLEDSQGRVWIASRRGFFCYSQGRIHEVPTPHPAVMHMTEDREGNLWIVTDGGGAAQLREKAFRRLDASTGLEQEVVSSIAEDGAGRVWLANRNGGVVQVAANDTVLSTPRGVRRLYTNVVHADRQDRLWFGGARTGLRIWSPTTNEGPTPHLPTPPSDLHVLFSARNGDMWFAADPGFVGYYRDGKPRTFSETDGLRLQHVRAIAETANGEIWIGGSNELARWDGDRFEKFSLGNTANGEPIHAFHGDAAGILWIGTAGGLWLKDGETFRHLTTAQGLADDILQHIVEDDQERLWFASRRGIFYAAKAELLAVARSGQGRVTSHLFGRNQGLIAVTPAANYSPGAIKARDGRLWFATSRGAVAIDPKKLPRDLPPPPVLIHQILMDDHVSTPADLRHATSRIRKFEFRFAALSYTAPEDVLMRHRLEGVDTQWLDTAPDRTASYSHLPPGAYRLRVIARNSAGLWNTEGATLKFTVAPTWWETLPFRLGVAALLCGISALLARAFFQRRLRAKLRGLEQAHALEKERARIARDLHDELGASLTEVGLLADRIGRDAPQQLSPQLNGLAWQTRRISTELSSIVWTMNGKNTSLDRLADFLRRYAERLFRNTDTLCLVKGVETIPFVALPPDPLHQLLAATKEALNNVLKHARAKEVSLAMRYADNVFAISIQDDGAGFHISTGRVPDGNGLRNMRHRLEEIGGELSVESEPGRGSRVVMRLPCIAVEEHNATRRL